jgi:hypothetical protein
MWNQKIIKDIFSYACVSDIIETRTTDCNVIFSPTTYYSFPNLYKVICLISVTDDSISRIEKFVNWISPAQDGYNGKA